MKQTHATLLAWMAAEGVTQAQLGRACGISQSYMSRIAHGMDTPLLPLAVKIHKATGVPYESMLKHEKGSLS